MGYGLPPTWLLAVAVVLTVGAVLGAVAKVAGVSWLTNPL